MQEWGKRVRWKQFPGIPRAGRKTHGNREEPLGSRRVARQVKVLAFGG